MVARDVDHRSMHGGDGPDRDIVRPVPFRRVRHRVEHQLQAIEQLFLLGAVLFLRNQTLLPEPFEPPEPFFE